MDQIVGDALSQNFTLRKGPIKDQHKKWDHSYEDHVDFTHLTLVVHKKLIFVDFVVEAYHSHQLKKKLGPSGCAIMTFLGATNPCEKVDVAQQMFLKI